MVLGAILVVLGLGMAVPLRSWLAQQAELATLQVQVEQAREQVSALEAEEGRWQDPAFIAAQARARLLMVFPGETGYIAFDTTAPVEDPIPVPEVSDQAWFERLWTGVRQADGADRADTVDSADSADSADTVGTAGDS